LYKTFCEFVNGLRHDDNTANVFRINDAGSPDTDWSKLIVKSSDVLHRISEKWRNLLSDNADATQNRRQGPPKSDKFNDVVEKIISHRISEVNIQILILFYMYFFPMIKKIITVYISMHSINDIHDTVNDLLQRLNNCRPRTSQKTAMVYYDWRDLRESIRECAVELKFEW
jgi:hypothetical protein